MTKSEQELLAKDVIALYTSFQDVGLNIMDEMDNIRSCAELIDELSQIWDTIDPESKTTIEGNFFKLNMDFIARKAIYDLTGTIQNPNGKKPVQLSLLIKNISSEEAENIGTHIIFDRDAGQFKMSNESSETEMQNCWHFRSSGVEPKSLCEYLNQFPIKNCGSYEQFIEQTFYA